jgi:hypothetical protein
MLLHNLICFLDSIAECREEYTSEDIRQQGSDNTETRDPVEMVGAAGVLQEVLQRLRKLESCRYRYVCLGQPRPVDRLLQAGGMLLAGMARTLEPAYLIPPQAWDVQCPSFCVAHRPRRLADIGIEQRTELAEELQNDVQRILIRKR